MAKLEDVIELGSSDDEAEPTFKKIKPTPNAMVHIPRKLHEVTIKPTKAKLSSTIPKALEGKNVTVTKISKGMNVLTNPYAVKNKSNGKPLQIKALPTKQIQTKQKPQQQPSTFNQMAKNPVALLDNTKSLINKKTVNPLSIMKKLNSQVVINKIPSSPKIAKNLIRIQSPRTINNLPPSITVTRTAGAQKRMAPVMANTTRKKQKPNIPRLATGEVLTVDLDDDEASSSSTASPQWYLRPEEQTSPNTMEEKNNEEPEPSKSTQLVEITIEDSPVKPLKDKRTCEVATEFTVTIDDSPVKNIAEKSAASGSDGEAKTDKRTPHSKKKLEYPKEAEMDTHTVEIEISPVAVEEPMEVDAEPAHKNETDNVIEIEESPLKVEGPATSTPKKNHPKPEAPKVPEPLKKMQEENNVSDDLSEFHPVYQSFIKLCFQLENSEDMKKIVEKKIKAYYRQVPKEYTESEEFTEMVAGKVLSMKAGPEKMYLYIKDIVDELNLQRKMAKSQILNSLNEKKNEEGEKYYYGADGEYDSKRQRQIRKLEKTLKKLHRAIQKLEDQEVDFDDEEDSVYLLTESDEEGTSNKGSDRQLEKDPKALLQRYKERMVRVHAKFCQLTNTKMPSEPRVQIDSRPGQAAGPAKRLERWINKKVPIGTPLPFPDFHDVLRCVREANDEDKLGWNEADIMEEARDLFTRCGKKLQRRRQENEWRIAASRISVEVDPADKNKDLLKKLDENKQIAAKKEAEVFNKYADRQSQLKLEAEEIGDKEAEESPGDDDDEELQHTDESSLENKEKRKERLKRLLQEKSKKSSEEVKSQSDGDVESKKSDQLEDKIKETNSQKDEGSGNRNVKDIENEAEKKHVEVAATTEDIENESVKTIDSDNRNELSTGEKHNNVMVTSDTEEVNEDTQNGNDEAIERLQTPENCDKAHSISDDSNKLESDVDELHLLQKLHSGNEINTSTLESSDSDSPIAISDTLGSSSDSKKRPSSDVISIENSSYSESEIINDVSDPKDQTNKNTKIVEEIIDSNIELECCNEGVEKKQARTNNDEYNESIEDILLASSDDEGEGDKNTERDDEDCVNLKDDSLSIGDTVIQGVDENNCVASDHKSADKQDDACSVESVACVSSKEDSPTNMDTDIQDSDNTMTPVQNIDDDSKTAESVEQVVDINSAESENSVPCDNVVELKESSPEEEMTVSEENSQELPDAGKGDCDKNGDSEMENVAKDDIGDSIANEKSAEEIMDIDNSKKSVVNNSVLDQIEASTDNNSDKL